MLRGVGPRRDVHIHLQERQRGPELLPACPFLLATTFLLILPPNHFS